ncbi:MAG TPA: hypothetical protein VGM23_08200 [Armatimonadota bacterium]
MEEPIQSKKAARIRPATAQDAGAIRQVCARNGMSDLDQATWRECWEAYPFVDRFTDVPFGWVLETEAGEVVGNLTSVRLLYEWEGRRLRACVASAWAVDPAHRGQSLSLTVAFFRQKNIDLLLNVSASPSTARILTGMRIPRIPVPGYATPCFWPVRHAAFVRAALLRRKIPCASLLARPAGWIMGSRDFLRRRTLGSPVSPVTRLPQFDDRFDTFWQEIASGPPRLRAVRTRAVLEWRFRTELRRNRCAIVAAQQAGRLAGYAVLVRRRQDTGMELYDVADLQAAGDDPAILRGLLLGSLDVAREEGADAVKFMSGTPAKRSPADSLHPYTYNLPCWSLYYKAAASLAPSLGTADAWDFSVFDTW